jgi:hypothetical protein
MPDVATIVTRALSNHHGISDLAQLRPMLDASRP